MRNTLAALLLALTAATASTPVSAYEEPAYEVARKTDDFEIRRYAPYVVVEAGLRGEYDQARNDAFRKLFAYISGANRAQAKLEMTVPVVTEPTAEKIEMTVPVLTGAALDGNRQVMQFVLPARFDEQTAPQPTDPELRVRRVEAQWLAVRVYSGRASDSNYRENAFELMRALAAADLTPAGPARFAVYNGPFTPWFLRRNEVMVPVAEPGAQ
jgi:hypothetical protein